MTPSDKQHYRKVAFCPHCSNESPQYMVVYHAQYSTRIEKCPRELGHDEWFVACCESCRSLIIYGRDDCRSHAITHFLSEDNIVIYPKNGGLPECVPANIDSIYREATTIRRRSPNAFSILIRKALEIVCDERSAKGKSLMQKLESLKATIGLPELISEHANLIRLLGNLGAHSDSTLINHSTADAIDQLFNVLIEFIYVTPHRLSEIKRLLNTT